MAYHNKVLSVPADWVTKTLLLQSEKDLLALCSYYGVKVDSATVESVKFDRDAFDVAKATVGMASFSTFIKMHTTNFVYPQNCR